MVEDTLEYLRPLNGAGTLWLVRQPATGRMLTARRVTPAQSRAFEILWENRAAGVPTVRDIQNAGEDEVLVLQDYESAVPLTRWVQDHGPQQTAVVLGVGIQLCSTLLRLHELGIWHGHLGPGCVLLDGYGQVFLLGLEQAVLDEPARPGVAPPPAETADQAGAGEVLNFLATGHSTAEGLAPEPLGSLIARCMTRDPRDQFLDIQGLFRALRDLDRARRQPDPPPRTRWGWLRQVPGFRSGNIAAVTLAVTAYLVAAIMAGTVLAVSLRSPANFPLGMPFLLWLVGCYWFLSDAAGLRSSIRPLQRLRGRWSYWPVCLLVVAAWAGVCALLTVLCFALLWSWGVL